MEMTESPSITPPPAWRKYWIVLSTRTQEDMAYRTNYFFGALFRFLPLVTLIFLWRAVYASSPTSLIGGMSYGDMVAYNALMFISRGFSSMPGMTRDVSAEIKDGLLNKYLVKPLSYFWYQVTYRLAHKVVFWLVAAVTFPPIFWYLRGYFTHPPTLLEWGAFLVSLVIAFWIGMLFSFLVGLLAFWFLEISTFLFVIMTIEFFLSGQMIPLNLLPANLQPFLTYMPFGYEGYWPCMILLGKIPADRMGTLLGVGLGWLALFYLLSLWAWKAGLKRYSAVGG